MKSKPKRPKNTAKKVKKKSVKKAEPVDTSKKIDELLNLNKAVGIARRVRVGQFQLPYVLPAA